MALHDLRITVVDGGKAKNYAGGGSNPFNLSDDVDFGVSNSNSNEVGQGLDAKTLTVRTFATQSLIDVAKQTAGSVFQYVVSDIGRSHGDSNYQAVINRQLEVAQDVGGLLTSTGSGAIAGASVGGPVGAVVGAVIGAASSVINLGFKYAEREREYQHTLFKESTSQAYQLARANHSATTGRLR